MRIFKNKPELKPGHKEWLVSFGQQYTGWYEHPFVPWAHKDGYLLIEAENVVEATVCAGNLLGRHWSMIYEKSKHTDAEWLLVFPRGELARVIA